MFDIISENELGEIIALVMYGIGIVFFLIIFIVLFRQARKSKVCPHRPIVLECATVVSKRTRYISITNYFLTFQFENGERKEFLVSGNDYGLIAVNDRGKLKYQGTNFISFIRE